MSTLAIMKARIADELARSDLTSQIAYAISDAIAAYEDERFFFNESRGTTFSTVAAQEFYGESDAAAIGAIQKFDYVFAYQGTQAYKLNYCGPEELEHLSDTASTTGFPWDYTYYNQQIRLYPIPDAVYTVRVGASIKVAAPASDAETGNAWMTHAERLIRARAKFELASHVLYDDDLANAMGVVIEEAAGQLRGRTMRLTMPANARVRPMEF